MTTASARFHLRRRVAQWLASEPQAAAGDDNDAGPDWDAWAWSMLRRGRLAPVGRVLVDRAVLVQRFRCVPERCAPGPYRGRSVSCCADVRVSLDLGERARLARAERSLAGYLARRDERWAGPLAWLDASAECLSRPGGRCAFARIDRAGRIRCHLRDLTAARRRDQSTLQPLSCRLFPLIVVDVGDGRTILTVLSGSTHRLVGAHRPARYPCLSDDALPLLARSMRGDLDWLFGRGFAEALARL